MTELMPYRGSPFRALIWKELNEALRWGIIGIIAVSLVILFGMSTASLAADVVAQGPPSSALMITALLIGSLIGLAQMVPESRGDRWSFLTHRPVGRSRIFAAKAVVGASLYLVATGIPYACEIIWVAIPGHWPMPFDIRLAEPGIVNILCGLVFYAAGLLAGMRNARWFGSRTLGFGAAIITLILTLVIADFREAVAVALVAISVVGAAAWGAFVSGAQYESQTRPSRIALALSLAPGFAIILFFVSAIVTLVVPNTRKSESEVALHSYALARDGTIVLTTTVYRMFHPGGGPLITAVTDLGGRRLRQFGDALSSDQLEEGVDRTGQLTLNPGAAIGPPRGFRSVDGLFVRLILPSRDETFATGELRGMMTRAFDSHEDYSTGIVWYFVRRSGLIEGYDQQSARRVGWIGPDGFAPESAGAPRPFAGVLQPSSQFIYNQSALAFPDAVYEVDLAHRAIRKSFTAAPSETVLVVSGMTNPQTSSRRDHFAAVIGTTRAIYVVNKDWTPQIVAARDSSTAGYGSVVVERATLAPDQPTVFWYYPARGRLSRQRRQSAHEQVITIGASDTATPRRLSLPPILPDKGSTDWFDRVTTDLTTPLPVPIWSTMSNRWSDIAPQSSIASQSYEVGVGQEIELSPVSAVPARDATDWWLIVVGAALSATIAYLLARRFALAERRRRLWTAIGFLAGPGGTALMIALLDWPVRERCPACGRKRIVTNELCEHCGAAFTTPARDGTEVFEALPA